MQLREGEQILRLYHRHLFPTVIKTLEIALGSVPFFLILYFIRTGLSIGTLFIAITVITAIFGLFLLHVFIDDRLDKLIITNQRIVFIDWQMVILKTENDIEIKDIQEVTVSIRGVLSKFRIFNFGNCKIETASSDLSIIFTNAPNPAELRDFILSLKRV